MPRRPSFIPRSPFHHLICLSHRSRFLLSPRYRAPLPSFLIPLFSFLFPLSRFSSFSSHHQSFYESGDIEVKLGVSVTELDPSTKTITASNGDKLKYDSALICTGAVYPSPPPLSLSSLLSFEHAHIPSFSLTSVLNVFLSSLAPMPRTSTFSGRSMRHTLFLMYALLTF